MHQCIICRFFVELDDVVLTHGMGSCICLRCYKREVAGTKPMPKELRKELIATLAGIVT